MLYTQTLTLGLEVCFIIQSFALPVASPMTDHGQVEEEPTIMEEYPPPVTYNLSPFYYKFLEFQILSY